MSYRVIEEDVVLVAGPRKTHGTLARPDAPGRFPAVLLIAGSGPTDRNWETPLIPGDNGSARLLAHELGTRGYVTLRYDKLGTGAADKPAKLPITIDDVEAEPQAALALLHGRPDVDPAHVFVAGHSEGGIYAVRLAAQARAQLAGLLLLSAAPKPVKDVLLEQLTKLGHAQAKQAGIADSVVDAQLAPIRADLDAFFAGKDIDPMKYATLPVIAAIVNPASAPMVRVLYAYDPAAALATLRGLPILVVSGGKDVQVPAEDGARLAAAGKQGGADVTAIVAPDADHVLKHEAKPREALDPGVEGRAYNAAGRTLDPVALDAILRFLADHTAKR